MSLDLFFHCFTSHIGNTWDLRQPVEMGTSFFLERGVFFMPLLLLLCCVGGKCELQESKPAEPTNFPGVKPFHNSNNEPQAFPEEERARLPVFTMDYPRIQVPFEFTLWVLLASFAKIGTFGWNTCIEVYRNRGFATWIIALYDRSLNLGFGGLHRSPVY